MKQYENYMNRQTVSDSLHQRLLGLEQEERRPARRPQARRWLYVAALAACLLLVVGVGRWALPWLGMGGSASDNSAAMSTEATSAGAAADTALPEEAVEEADGDTADEAFSTAETTEDTAGTAAEGAETASEESAGAENGGVPAWEEIENPAWLPEGYSLASTEIDETTGWYRMTWTDNGGGEIQLEGAPDTVVLPAGIPVLDPADAEALNSLSPDEDGWWRFLLVEEDCWLCFSTNGDPEILWQAATGLTEG